MSPVVKLPIIQEDPWLEPYTRDVHERFERYKAALQQIEEAEGSLLNFAKGHLYYGIHFSTERNGWVYREWAPHAHQLYLTGDFNEWDRGLHKLEKNNKGDWEIFLPYEEYKTSFVHQSKVKVTIHAGNGITDRIPAYIRRVVQDLDTNDFAGQLWFPEKPFEWASNFVLNENINHPIIYECHVGMAQEVKGWVCTRSSQIIYCPGYKQVVTTLSS